VRSQHRDETKEATARPRLRYRDVDGQGGLSCTLQTQGDQSPPSTTYECPIPRTGDDGFAPVLADVGQGEDWLWFSRDDEGGAHRDDFGRETVRELKGVLQTNYFV